MVSLMGCGTSPTTGLTLDKDKGTLHSASGYGCFGVSNTAGPMSSLFRKPMPDGKTAVLAINGAALPAQISFEVSEVLAPDGQGHSSAEAVEVWSGKARGRLTKVDSETVPPHGSIFLILSAPQSDGEAEPTDE